MRLILGVCRLCNSNAFRVTESQCRHFGMRKAPHFIRIPLSVNNRALIERGSEFAGCDVAAGARRHIELDLSDKGNIPPPHVPTSAPELQCRRKHRGSQQQAIPCRTNSSTADAPNSVIRIFRDSRDAHQQPKIAGHQRRNFSTNNAQATALIGPCTSTDAHGIISSHSVFRHC
jgi:hypothetical protein